jgi:hypothetical protein
MTDLGPECLAVQDDVRVFTLDANLVSFREIDSATTGRANPSAQAGHGELEY